MDAMKEKFARCCRTVLKITLAVGGAGESAVDTCCLSSVRNTGRFAAPKVAAHAGAKEHATHRAISMILQQSEGKRAVDTTAKRMGRLRIETSRAFPAYAGNTRCSRWRASRRYRASRKRERKLPGPSASLAAASPASAMTAMAAAAPASGVPATAP